MSRPRLTRILAVLAALGCVPACHGPAHVPPVDLVRAFPEAERRATGPIDRSVILDRVSVGGDARTAVLMDAPARITWRVQLPSRARLRARLAAVPRDGAPAGVDLTLRIAIAEGRSYHELLHTTLTAAAAAAGWQPIDVDLGAFSGWQWSLFYHPSRLLWSLVVNADTPGGRAAIADPVIAFAP